MSAYDHMTACQKNQPTANHDDAYCICGPLHTAYLSGLQRARMAVFKGWPDPCVSMCGDCRTCWAWVEWGRVHSLIVGILDGTS